MVVRPLWRALAHYRPRAPTLVLLTVISALLILANLSDELGHRFLPTSVPRDTADWTFDVQDHWSDDASASAGWSLSYGWPLLWRQYVILGAWGALDIRECRSLGRLAENVVMWLAMLAVPAAACEWLLRRYRPRLRWSLRTMLAATGLAAICCGWFAAARNRASIEDPLIAEIENDYGRVWVERWGPDWLEILGADRFRMRIVGAEISQGGRVNARIETVLTGLARLPDLQCLFLSVDQLTPGMIDAMRDMRQLRALQLVVENVELPGVAEALGDALADKQELRTLAIELDDWCNDSALELVSQEFLTAIGRLTQLETLAVKHSPGDRLDYLANLAGLKWLTLDVAFSGAVEPTPTPPLLSRLPTLPNLETIDLRNSEVADGDLHYLARLPRLRSLNLADLYLSGAGLDDLASLESLEELAIDGYILSAAAPSLFALKHLRTLHIIGLNRAVGGPGALDNDQLRTLEALRRSKPELIIDGDGDALCRSPIDKLPLQYGGLNPTLKWDARETVRRWQEEQAQSE